MERIIGKEVLVEVLHSLVDDSELEEDGRIEDNGPHDVMVVDDLNDAGGPPPPQDVSVLYSSEFLAALVRPDIEVLDLPPTHLDAPVLAVKFEVLLT
jgi:hypothetical protein